MSLLGVAALRLHALPMTTAIAMIIAPVRMRLGNIQDDRVLQWLSLGFASLALGIAIVQRAAGHHGERPGARWNAVHDVHLALSQARGLLEALQVARGSLRVRTALLTRVSLVGLLIRLDASAQGSASAALREGGEIVAPIHPAQ